MSHSALKDWILVENDDYVVVNKPAGLLSIPDREGKEISLKTLLQERRGAIWTVHRLDKDTSGLIVFACNENSHRHLSLQFEDRQTRKFYLALVLGTPAEPSGTIERPLAEHPVKKGTMVVNQRGKEAITDYTLLASYGAYSWLQLQIHTGRTHQIRVHLQDLGHPVAADPLYGDGKPLLLSSLKHRFKLSKNEETERPLLNRLALHAWQLKWTDEAGRAVELEAPLPKDLRATLQQLEKIKKGR